MLGHAPVRNSGNLLRPGADLRRVTTWGQYVDLHEEPVVAGDLELLAEFVIGRRERNGHAGPTQFSDAAGADRT